MSFGEAIGLDVIGYLAGALTTIAFVPQVLHIVRKRSAHDISWGMFSMFSVGVAMWLWYGIRLSSLPLIVANSITLAAYFGGQMVGSTSVDGPINCCDVHVRLELSGFVFDSLRLFGAGRQNDGAAFMLIDNVRINPVPLPAGLWLLASGCMLLPRLRSRRDV